MGSTVNRYYEEDTGRTVVYGYEDEVSAVPIAQLEEWRENKRRKEIIKHGATKHYVNCYHEPVAELNSVLKVNELGALMKLIPYIKMHTKGALYFEGSRMSVSLIAKAIDRSPRQANTIVEALYVAGVLWREKIGRSYVYGVKERYHSMGYVIDGANFTKVFQVKTRTDIRNISIQAAGVLYKMLPFFNYEHFVLCTNPNEADIEKIYPVSHREFAERVGVDRKVIERGIKELTRFGFLGKFSSYNGELYIVNPDVASRRKSTSDESTEAARNTFRLAEKASAEVAIGELPF